VDELWLVWHRACAFPGVMRVTSALATLPLLLACAGCTGNQAQGPVGPSSVSTQGGAVATLTVTGPPSMDQSFQLAATALLADNTTRDVTSVATWISTNPTIAQVSASGMVTVNGSGGVEVDATYSGVTGSLFLRVSARPTTMAVSGYVHEIAPSEHPLSGVTIQITSGPDAGATATSDANGNYQLAGLHPGVVGLAFGRDGYYTYRINSLTLSQNTGIYVWLYPTPPSDASGTSASARCNDGSWSWAGSRDQACTSNGGIAYTVCPGALCETPSSEHSQGISRKTS
jgi:hypothetical protein